MDILGEIFGQGKDLTALQMGTRSILLFIIAFILIRVAGRRSFGMRTPLDNIITILLGAVLSRAVVGASALPSTVFAGLVIVVAHRACGWLISKSHRFSRLLEGQKIPLFENGKFMSGNMKRALVCEEDIMQFVRKTALTEDLGLIEKVYMEKNGEISVIKKKNDQKMIAESI